MHIIQLIITFFISLRHADFIFYILVTQKSSTHVQKSPVKKNGKLRFTRFKRYIFLFRTFLFFYMRGYVFC